MPFDIGTKVCVIQVKFEAEQKYIGKIGTIINYDLDPEPEASCSEPIYAVDFGNDVWSFWQSEIEEL